jgi:hypothetical protein
LRTYIFLRQANIWLQTNYKFKHPDGYRENRDAVSSRAYSFTVGDYLEVSPEEIFVRGVEWVVSIVNFKYRDCKPFNEKDAISYMSNIELAKLELDGIVHLINR